MIIPSFPIWHNLSNIENNTYCETYPTLIPSFSHNLSHLSVLDWILHFRGFELASQADDEDDAEGAFEDGCVWRVGGYPPQWVCFGRKKYDNDLITHIGRILVVDRFLSVWDHLVVMGFNTKSSGHPWRDDGTPYPGFRKPRMWLFFHVHKDKPHISVDRQTLRKLFDSNDHSKSTRHV